MSTLLFLIVIACFVLVAGWYVGNERAKADGEWGLLGFKPDETADEEPDAPKYRRKTRGVRANPAPAAQQTPPATGEPAGAYRAKAARGRFQDLRERAYHSRGTPPRFGERPRKAPAPGRPAKDEELD